MCVCGAKAWLFDDAWAKEVFGRDWTKAKVYGKVVKERGKNEWLVEFDPVEEGEDADRHTLTCVAYYYVY